jgi:HAD superfamily hydrolase (TIGR01490 family)
VDDGPPWLACGRLLDPYDGAMAAPLLRSAAFFDLDKTIIAKSSTLAFSKPFQAGGLITRGAVLRSAYAQFVYVVGGADHDQIEKMRAFMSTLVAGWDVATVREIVADTLHNIVDPLVYDEAVSLIEQHKAAGRDVVIVSTSGTEVVEPIGAMLGADIVIASRLEEVDGKYTGNIDYYAYAEEKARAIVELAGERGYDLERCFAYSDSVTDVPMLDAVGHPFAVNPDKELRRAAIARNWPVLLFTKPVALRSRVASRPTLAALAVGGVVAVGGVLWANARRKRLGA